LLDLDKYKTEIFPQFSIQSTVGGQTTDEGADRVGKSVLYAWLYPNFMINRYGPFLDTNCVIPVTQTKTKVVFD